MKRLAAIALLLLSGCAIVPTDGWPILTWRWDSMAKAYRAEKAWDKTQAQAQTNQPAK